MAIMVAEKNEFGSRGPTKRFLQLAGDISQRIPDIQIAADMLVGRRPHADQTFGKVFQYANKPLIQPVHGLPCDGHDIDLAQHRSSGFQTIPNGLNGKGVSMLATVESFLFDSSDNFSVFDNGRGRIVGIGMNSKCDHK